MTTIATPFTVPRAAAAAPTRRKRGRPRDPEADGRILAAAADLILRNGFDHMTVDEVAARAGVGKATVYRRWARKEDLAVAALQQVYDARIPIPDTGSVRGDLLAAYSQVLAFARTEQGAAYLRTSIVESVRDTRICEMYRGATAQAESVVHEVFQRGIARGEIQPEIDVNAAVQVLGGILIIRTVTGQDLPNETEVEGLIDLVLGGTAA